MSVVKSSSHNCACQHNENESGVMGLHVVHSPSLSAHPNLAEVKELANQMQQEYMSHMCDVTTNSYLGSHHAHLHSGPDHSELPQLMQSAGLTMRVQHTDPSDNVVCAEVTPSALADILRDGVATVEAPMNRGSFRLHSGKAGQVTGIEFMPGNT